jgi:large subunit ribosomal protein L33
MLVYSPPSSIRVSREPSSRPPTNKRAASGPDRWYFAPTRCRLRAWFRVLKRVQAMAKGKRKLEFVHLACQETGDLNYTLRRKSGGEKLKVKKYSPRLRRHTLHVEKKK